MWFAIVIALSIVVAALLLIRAYMKWSNVWCTSNVRMDGKTVIVTGGNAGLGYETAKALALRGAHVILACRNEQRGVQARDTLISATGNKGIEYRNLDLCSLASVRRFAQEVSAAHPRIHVLINNAGMHGGGRKTTEDGLLEGVQVNYFAPFLLTLLLLPALEAGRGRVVNVASLCHFLGEVELDKFNRINKYGDNATYSNSKLAQIIFTRELARRLRASGVPVTVNALHPGVIYTGIMKDSTIGYQLFFICWCWLCHRSPEAGAQTSIYLAVADEVENVTGKYFVDCKPGYVHRKVIDKEFASKLWDYTQELVRCQGEFPLLTPCANGTSQH